MYKTGSRSPLVKRQFDGDKESGPGHAPLSIYSKRLSSWCSAGMVRMPIGVYEMGCTLANTMSNYVDHFDHY